ncbi:MAG: glycosyltransferase family 4 protein [Parcubacteria group bacterium]|jgi:glycosyltransferase involved in cell wall biosynthesis
MKILFISNLFPPNAVGGYERLCAQVVENFSKENDVTVVTSSFGNKISQNDNFTVYRDLKLLAGKNNIYEPFEGDYKKRSSINIENVIKLKNIIIKESPDFIFVWNLYFFDQSLLDTLEKSKIKTVFFLTDNWLISFLNSVFLVRYFDEIIKDSNLSLTKIIKKYLYKVKVLIFNKKINLKSDAIFSSRFMQKLYSQSGISFNKSSIIYNGVELENYSNKQINRDFDIKNKKIKILFAGRVVQIKGVHVLIKAFYILKHKYKIENLELTIIGDKTDKKYNRNLHDLMIKYGIVDSIKIKDFVKEAELFQEFQKYDIYTFPSLYEPFSLTLIYAMAAGIPTIASNAGGNSEIIINNETGLIYDKFSPEDLAKKIKLLIYNKKLRKELSVNGIKKAHDFGFEKMCKELKNYLKNNYEK